MKDAALRLLEDDVRFRAGEQKGIEHTDRGEFIEEEEMDARVNRLIQAGAATKLPLWKLNYRPNFKPN